MGQTIRKHSVVLAGHRTSVSLEEDFWKALRELASVREMSLNQLVNDIDRDRSGNLSSAIRVFILREFRRGL